MGISGEGMIEILKKLGDNIIGVEVGVCRGENIKGLLDSCPNIRKIYGIDPWQEYPAIDQATCEKNYAITKALLQSYILDDNVELIKKCSLDAVDKFDDESLAFVYVDGNHSEALADMKAWWPKVKIGGVLSGHDYRPKDVEVRAAVAVFAEEMGLSIKETKHFSWYFNKNYEV